MKKTCLLLSLLLTILSLPNALSAQPAISTLSPDIIARSGRLLIEGSGFGVPGGTSFVEIDGLEAPVTRWSDTLIAAYVPEATSLGNVTVTVFADGVPSNAAQLSVTMRQSDGRVMWRFQADASYINQRPAIGPDGTIVAHDSSGNVYALTPDGGLKWIFKTRLFAKGPPSVDANGTVYVASVDRIDAISQDGTLLWEFADPLGGGQGIIAGPTVGPDGNIYGVMDAGGIGAFALSPAGDLLWSNPGDPAMSELGQVGAEIVFGPSTPGGAADQLYVAFDDIVAPNSQLHAFRMTGEQAWAHPLAQSKDSFSFAQQQPQVGPDGTVFLSAAVPIGSSFSLNTFSPATGALLNSYFPTPGNGISIPSIGSDGRIYIAQSLEYLEGLSSTMAPKWKYFDGSILTFPVVSPANDIVVTGGSPNFGMPGFVRAFTTKNGQLVWSFDLGVIDGGNQVMKSYPRFSPSGQIVYFGTVIAGSSSSDTFSYLYALDTSAKVPPRAPGRVHSLRAAMDPDGVSLDLSWDPSCSGTATDYEIMEGTLGNWNDYTPVLCSTGGATSAVVTPSSGTSYYLIVPRDGDVEGSYGLDGNGFERPRSTTQCATLQLLGGCQ